MGPRDRAGRENAATHNASSSAYPASTAKAAPGRAAASATAIPGPVEEVERFVGEGAHAHSRDVEEVRLAGGAVGHSPSQDGSLLNEHDADGRPAAEEMNGGENAARPTADDRDRRTLEPQPGKRHQGETVEGHEPRLLEVVSRGPSGPLRYTPIGVYRHSDRSARS